MASPYFDYGDGVTIHSRGSGEHLEISLQSPQGGHYGPHHIQTWHYVGLGWRTATAIARGFPEYWNLASSEERAEYISFAPQELPAPPKQGPDRTSAKLKRTSTDEEIAEYHRAAAVDVAGQAFIPLNCVFQLPAPDIDRMLANVTDENDRARRRGVLSLEQGNPFKLLSYRMQFGDHNRPTLKDWRSAANHLLHEFLKASDLGRSASAFGRAEEAPSTLPEDVTHERGPTLTQQQQLENTFCRSSRRPVQWGPLFYDAATIQRSHFCVAGMPRSGKTTLLRLLFQSLHDDEANCSRFVVYDAKPDLVPCMFPPGSLTGPLLDDQAAKALYLLCPFDARCTAWDIAQDANNQSTAAEIAETLFPDPDPRRKDEFFSPAARDVTTEVMVALARTAGSKWTFYDLLCALQLENIEVVLSSTPRGRQLYATYLEGKSSATEDLPRTLRAKTAMLLPAAFAWSQARRKLSLRQWVQSHTASIVLSNDERHFKANNEINRIVLNLLFQHLMAVKNPPARTFVYLDEMEHLGRIEPLTRVAEKGAGLQVHTAIAFHDLDTLKEVYGGATEGILAMCNFLALLRVRSLRTSAWASELVGTPEVKVKQKSTQYGKTTRQSSSDDDDTSESSQQSESESEHYSSRRLVLPDEIRDLPLAAEAQALTGYFVGPQHGPYRGTLPASKCLRTLQEIRAAEQSEQNFYALWPAVPGVSPFISQADERLDLPDDTFRTLYELGFRKSDYEPPPEMSSPSPPAPASPPPAHESKDAAESPPATDLPPKPPQRRSPKDVNFDFNFDDD